MQIVIERNIDEIKVDKHEEEKEVVIDLHSDWKEVLILAFEKILATKN